MWTMENARKIWSTQCGDEASDERIIGGSAEEEPGEHLSSFTSKIEFTGCLRKSTAEGDYFNSYNQELQTSSSSKTRQVMQLMQVSEGCPTDSKGCDDCFEKASLPNISEEEKRKILHFVIIGGGPTGVEFGAELHVFLIEDMVKLYPAIEEFLKIRIIQQGEHILNMFS
uniref:FAD/NAD(P)-binding domain-containing protein n=1 Tax=Triticum urartu TaxID=4572 RepID=A0A8R7TV17_TRIUA